MCAGIRNLGDSDGVQLAAEQVGDTGVTADSHTNLHGNVLLYDEIAEIDDIAELAEVEEPRDAPVMPVMSVMPSRHGVEFGISSSRISLMNSLLGGACEQTIWLKPSRRLTVFDTGDLFFHL